MDWFNNVSYFHEVKQGRKIWLKFCLWQTPPETQWLYLWMGKLYLNHLHHQLVWRKDEKMFKYLVNWKSYLRQGSKLCHTHQLDCDFPLIRCSVSLINCLFPFLPTNQSSCPLFREHSIHTENSCHSLQGICLMSSVVLLQIPDISLSFSDIILTK